VAAGRLIANVACGIAGLTLLAACSANGEDAPVPIRAAIVGVWVHGGDPSRVRFYSSGKASFHDVPKELLFGDGPSGTQPHVGPWKDLISGVGSWRKPEDGGDALPVLPGSLDHVGFEFSIRGDTITNRRITLLYGDDLELSYSFERASKPGN